MFWQQLQILMPSIVAQWLVFIVFGIFSWLAWTRIYRNQQFNWKAPVLVASVFWFYGFANTVVNIYQNTKAKLLRAHSSEEKVSFRLKSLKIMTR